jgi:predicted GNAT family N-acyltransferase
VRPPEPGIRVALATGARDLAEVFAVRSTVFVDEQGVPVELERDDADATADHFLARLDGTAVGTVRMVAEPPGFSGVDHGLGPVAHLGRLAVLGPARGLGIGGALRDAVEGRAVDRGFRVLYLAAQTHAVGFYAMAGYEAFGPEFDDAGLPHRHMVRVL